jgi:hypothetical protein
VKQIRKRRDDVHGSADDERLTLVLPVESGGHRRHDPEVRDVSNVDLPERAEPRVRKVARGQPPLADGQLADQTNPPDSSRHLTFAQVAGRRLGCSRAAGKNCEKTDKHHLHRC